MSAAPSTRYPAAVDVAIVGSGPTGAAYARILSEEAPGATIAMFEVGPTVSDPPGAHVKNIEDPAQRAARPARLGGSGRRRRRRSIARRHVKSGAAPGAARHVPPRDGLSAFPGEDGLPVAAMSSNVGGMAAHWTARARDRATASASRSWRRLSTSCSTRPSACSA